MASLLFWTAMYLANPNAVDWTGYRVVQIALLPNGSQFALGTAIWALLCRGVTPVRVGAAFVFFLTSLIAISHHAFERAVSAGLDFGPTSPWLAFTAGVALLLAATRLQPWLSGPLMSRRLALAGLATYPLYLVHQEAGTVVFAVLRHAGASAPVALAAMLGSMLVLAIAIARWAEPWLRGRLARLSWSRQPAPWPLAR